MDSSVQCNNSLVEDIIAKIPVSVIVCASNEATNLKRHLPVLLAQRYSNALGHRMFELIVIDDCSTDETSLVLSEFKEQFPELKIVHIPPELIRDFPGKKFPLSKGVEVAIHDHLVLIDADCCPESKNWMHELIEPFTQPANGLQIVGGFGKLATHRGLLNAFSRWETLHTFLQYWSYSKRNLPYMVVGRNLACLKSTLLSAQKAKIWTETPSGDDDLLVHITRENTRDANPISIVSSQASFTKSEAMKTWQEWLRQKQRHVSTGKLYRPSIQFLLAGYALSHAGVWVLFMLLLLFSCTKQLLLLMALRCLIYWFSWAKTAKVLQESRLMFYFPLFDIGWMIYNFVLSPFIFWKNKQQWK